MRTDRTSDPDFGRQRHAPVSLDKGHSKAVEKTNGPIVAVVIIMLRNKVVTGRWIPLAVGLAVVAGIISMTTGPAVEASLAQGITLGILANLALLALVTAIRHLVLRIMP